MKQREMLRRLKAGENPLELSIQKWQDIVNGKGKDDAELNCALCEVYRNHIEPFTKQCLGCPIFKRTKKKYCGKTPYDSLFTNAERNLEYQPRNKSFKVAYLVAAQAELDFLFSLRPKALNCVEIHRKEEKKVEP